MSGRRPQKSKSGRRTKQPAAIRCAIYTRKSTDDGLEQEFNSLDAQREAGEAFIASQQHEGWQCLPEHYDDGGFSGGNVERPALKRLLADIKAGKIDCVVVYKVDRLSRSLLDFAKIMEVFDDHNVSFVSVTQHFNTTHSMGRLTLNILLSFAQFEREIIGERIRDKIAAQRRKGKWAGGVPVLGYDVDRSNASPKLVVNPDEAARVRTIFTLYLNLGSLLPLVDALAERSWSNKQWMTKKGAHRGGRPFEKSSLYALLTNPIYIGKIRHKTDLYDGEHEPIIDPGLFRRVQAHLKQNGRNGGICVRNKHGALLKQLLVCKACGRAMVHTFTGKKDRRYRYYTCSKAIQCGRESCRTPSLPAAEIEAAVVDQIRGIADDARLRSEVLRQGQAHIDAELAALRQEQADYQQALRQQQSAVHRLTTGKRSADRQLAELQERITHARRRMQELKKQIAALEQQRLKRADVNAAFANFDNLWNALSPREQAQVLALLIDRVEFDAAESSIAVTFHPSAIKALADGRLGESP